MKNSRILDCVLYEVVSEYVEKILIERTHALCSIFTTLFRWDLLRCLFMKFLYIKNTQYSIKINLKRMSDSKNYLLESKRTYSKDIKLKRKIIFLNKENTYICIIFFDEIIYMYKVICD